MIESKGINTEKFYYNDLFRDYIFNFENVCEYYQYDYRNIDGYKKRVSDLKTGYDEENRSKIYNILKDYNKNIGCSKKTIENIEKLKSPKSAVVIGGQQPGFLTGPIFIIFKILTILKVSSYFEKELKIPIIPCFWNASDDNSFNQIDNLNIINKVITNIKLDLSDFDPKTRYSDIYLTDNRFKEAIEKMESILHFTSFKTEIMYFYKNILANALKNCSNTKGEINVSSFFSTIITRMFSGYGLVIIDPADVELKKLSCNLLEFDVSKHYQISHLINSTGKKLNSCGYHSQLSSTPGTLDFFYCVDGIRKKIYSDSDNLFEISDKRYDKKEFWDLMIEKPSAISLNVILRPLFQDKLLPVLCSICGPGESSYFAQLKPVYNIYGLKMPVIYPRFSSTIVEKKIKKLIVKLKITDIELGSSKEEIIRQAVSKRLKIDPGKLVPDLESDIQVKLEKLENVFLDLEMSISSSFDRIKRNIKKEIKVLNKKLYSELKRQDEFTVEGINKIYMNIFPDNNLQEREISIISYLNRYGFGFIDDLYSTLKPMDFMHKILEII
ncbi:MAG: bacillithiol biosynthesis cysteine-adding enzyme BshC [Actinobacteria bacterium]|nr:bacillithiol biosynthesis cysteine-adding enzyme BshC [Actinomycetota bacterium]